jgi:cystathionine gamma-lyase/cystathionine gamma-lyase/homocysteine desulfhydrase
MRKDNTLLVREKVDFYSARPISTPIFQTSAFHSGDPNFYSRNTNPNFADLEQLLYKLDHATGCISFSSGMAAISAAIHLLKPGDTLVAGVLIYGCTYRYLNDYCAQMGIKLIFTDLSKSDYFQAVINTETSMVFFETPTNPFLKVIDIKMVSDHLKEVNPLGIVVVDNTWATPLHQKPLDFGADITLYSGSKFFSGHSDVIIGAACVKSDVLYRRLKDYRFYQGALPDAFSAWLTRRSMQTLHLRLQRHIENTQKIAEYLRTEPLVEKIYLPEVDGTQLKAYGGILFFQLATTSLTHVECFMKSLKLFDMGTSMASVASAVANPFNGSHLSMSPSEKAAIGLNEFCIRLSLGLEDSEDLISDLHNAFKKTTNLIEADKWIA